MMPQGAAPTVYRQVNTGTTLLLGITYGNSLFVAVGQTDGTSGLILTSPDGITWTRRTCPINKDLWSVVWSGALFVAVGGDYQTTGVAALTSPDGVTWTDRSAGVASPTSRQLNAVCYGNSLFVAVGFTSIERVIYTSTDGITWTNRYTSSDYTGGGGVSYNGSYFITAGGAGSVGPNWIVGSTDGLTWSLYATLADAASGRGFAYIDSKWYIAFTTASGGAIMTSTDAVTWSAATIPKDVGLRGLAHDGTRFIAAGNFDGVDTYMLWSTDGETWEELRNGIVLALYAAASNGSLVCAVGAADATSSCIVLVIPEPVAVSPRGVAKNPPASRQIDSAALVRQAWGDEWLRREIAYEFSNGRKFEDGNGPYIL